MHCCSHIVKTEGFSGLYKGMAPSIISGSAYVGFQMSFYDLFKRLFINFSSLKSKISINLIAGSCAGIIAQTICYPVDTIRRRMQTDGLGGTKDVYKNTFDCFKKMISKEGFISLFRGYKANIIKTIPSAAIQFASFDAIKMFLIKG